METNNDGTTYVCDSCGALEDDCRCGDFVSTRPAEMTDKNMPLICGTSVYGCTYRPSFF